MPKKAVRGKAKAKSVSSGSARRPVSKPKKVKGVKRRVAAGHSKPVSRPVSKKASRSSGKSKDYGTSIYEEVTITCPGCGKVSRVIKLAGISTEGLICQRCAKGEMEIEDMDF